ncbi:MAG: F0F1 ATP synthase subunit alpha [Candidatus Levybacteria bacterium]|nr:F0F1 ATP synthase subunit alpha [Candidatus Levybacteria bacterium]
MKSFQYYLTTSEEVGFVEASNHSIVYVSGLPQATLQEIVMFETGEFGVILSLSRAQVEILLFSKYSIKAGTRVTRTGRKQEMPVGFELLGQTIDAFARPLEAGKIIEQPKVSRPIDIDPSGINTRKRITSPLETGVTMVDLLVPLGKGQRQLVIGNRKTGKTSFLYQTILKQARLGTICIYAGIGRKKTDIKKIENYFKASGIIDNTIIIASSSEDPSGITYLTPFAAMTLAEYFRDEGHDVLLVLDDLFTHAKVYREIMLIGRRFPGRNAYPADIFYTHARLLERAGNFVLANGSEHAISCFPVVESVEGDIAGFIQTNLMSMTDGHIYFDVEMFAKGNRPAINPFVSVSRVGRQTQTPLRLSLHRELVSFLTLHQRLENFSHFSAEAGTGIKKTMAVAERIFAYFTQGAADVKALDLQIIIFGILWIDYWNDTPTMERDIQTITHTYENTIEAQTMVKDVINSSQTLNDMLQLIKKRQEKLLHVLGVQTVAVANI